MPHNRKYKGALKRMLLKDPEAAVSYFKAVQVDYLSMLDCMDEIRWQYPAKYRLIVQYAKAAGILERPPSK